MTPTSDIPPYAISDDANKGGILVTNDFAKQRERFPIPVYNTIDKLRNDFAPPKFRYLLSHIYVDSPSNKHAVVPFPIIRSTSTECCICSESAGCNEQDQHCYCVNKTQMHEFKERRSITSVSYSCHANCTCHATCGNRLGVGIGVKMKIVKDCCRGYVIVAEENIPANTYISEYVGEVIPEVVGEERTKLYSRIGQLSPDALYKQYRVVEDSPLTLADMESLNRPRFIVELCAADNSVIGYIDAFRFGNVSRFLQTSCQSNIRIQTVYHLPDAPMPRILFFASRDITAGEELVLPHDPYDCVNHTFHQKNYHARYRIFTHQQQHQQQKKNQA